MTGLEPVVSPLSEECFIHLSYIYIIRRQDLNLRPSGNYPRLSHPAVLTMPHPSVILRRGHSPAIWWNLNSNSYLKTPQSFEWLLISSTIILYDPQRVKLLVLSLLSNYLVLQQATSGKFSVLTNTQPHSCCINLELL